MVKPEFVQYHLLMIMTIYHYHDSHSHAILHILHAPSVLQQLGQFGVAEWHMCHSSLLATAAT